VKVEYDPALVEEAVHLLARADPARWRAYRKRVDPLYDAGDREARLPAATLDLLREWGGAGAVHEALLLLEGVDRALVARSRRPGDEGADLLVGAERTVLLRLGAERFADAPALARFLRHEVRHVADMLDPAFGYRPDLGMGKRTRAEQELVRARYRVLWDLAVDGREGCPVPPEQRRAELDRAFSALDPGQRARLAAAAPRTHDALLSVARDPWAFLGEPRTKGAAKGEPCPLCGFPTHDWDPEPPSDAIRADFPAWQPVQGACRQCGDLYRVAAS
jgi:hypothetical protein